MTSHTTSPSVASALTEWAHLALVLLSRGYRAFLLTLAAVALVPTLFGAGSFVVESGSMQPAISVGDVVVATPYEQPDKVAVGRVYVFDDPAGSHKHPIVHRVVERRDDGDYTTAGDANEVTDMAPLKTDRIRARAILLAPYIGLPVIWVQSGQWFLLALWLLVTIAAFIFAGRNLDGEPPKWTLLRLLRDRKTRHEGSDTADTAHTADTDTSASLARVLKAPTVLGIALAVLATGLGSANAGFTAQNRNSENTWTVGTWTQPYISAVLADQPHLFWLFDEASGTIAQDRSGNNRVGRYGAGVTLSQTGALPNNPGTAIRATTTGVPAVTQNPVGATVSHTAEMWFNTTTTTGGYLIGFESSATSNATTPAPQHDRVLRMDTAGRLTYGDWNVNPKRIITTPRGYNDGAWHQVVITNAPSGSGAFGQSVIYVDGVAVISGQTSKEDPITGYWHVGGGSGGPAFNGRLDNVSIYTTTLTAARVAEHYRVR